MGYINSVAYVQHKIDNILWDVREWAWAYINNIVYKRRFLPNLFAKLCILFDIFLCYNILIQAIKFYLNYFDVTLLG